MNDGLFSDLVTGALGGLAYGAVGLVLMALGFLVVDLLTPGQLRDIVWRDRNGNAAVVVAAGLLGTGAIVVTAILTSEDDLGHGLASTATYGILGLVLMALSFVAVDLLTPGKLGDVICDPQPHPAAYVTAASHLALAAIVAASIS
jgi:uncharacterized membrane protein YjfL (UPF0719 family)